MSRMREEEVARTLAMVMTERLHPEFMTCREVVCDRQVSVYRKARDSLRRRLEACG